MESLKDILELIGKAKDIRLNAAILIVSLAIIAADKHELLNFGAISQGVLNALIFVTSVRLVAWVIGATFDYIEQRKKLAQQEAARGAAQKLAIEAQENDYKNMISKINDLDVQQLYIIQSLRKTNTFSVSKGAPLYTLKNAGIISAAAVGPSSESVQLTALAKKVFESELWKSFSDIKRNSSLRFFRGLEQKEMDVFKRFLKEESRNTRFHNGRTYSYTGDNSILNRYSCSILFQQPQANYYYTIDPIAKSALAEVSLESEGVNLSG